MTLAPASHISGIMGAQGFQHLEGQMSDETTPDVDSGKGAASDPAASKP
ncbi:MAG: hypothetical protein WAS01_00260 [Nostocoides sp.]